MFASLILKAQTIVPNTSTSFCPNQETEFTVTLTKAFSSMQAIGGATVTVQP